MTQTIRKMAVDLAAAVFLLTAMGFRITGSSLHEWIGIGTFTLFVVHNALNYRWYAGLLKGNYGWFRIVNTSVNMLLLLAIFVLFITGMITSRILFPFVPSPEGMLVRQLHALAAYWSLILASIHLGLHWKTVMVFGRKMIGNPKPNRVRSVILRLLVILIAVFGVKASFDRNVGSKLVMYYSFDFWNPDESVLAFYGTYLAITAVWIVAAHYTMKSLRYCFST